MVRELHQLSRSRLVFRLEEYGAYGVDAEGFLVPLLFLDEVVVGAELLEHICGVHGSAISFVEEMGELRILRAVRKTQGEHRIRFDGEPFGFARLLPEV